MGIALEPEDFDKLRMEHTGLEIYYVNDFPTVTETDNQRINNMIFTVNGDVLSNLPTCGCTSPTTGEYNLGLICSNCNQPVKEVIETTLEPRLWIRQPQGVSKIMHPLLVSFLQRFLRLKNEDMFRWLIDTGYKLKGQNQQTALKLMEDLLKPHGLFKRGYNHFVDNFHAMMAVFFSKEGARLFKVFRVKNLKTGVIENELAEFIVMFDKVLFSEAIPLVNKSLIVIESVEGVGRYMDAISVGTIEAVNIVKGIDADISHQVMGRREGLISRNKQNRLSKALYLLSDFYYHMITNNIGKKKGAARKLIFGVRPHNSMRAVISSNTRPHKYDEIGIPWQIAIENMRADVMNKLKVLGYNYMEAKSLMEAHTIQPHPLLIELMTELFNECSALPAYKWSRGFAYLMVRYPSLARGSIGFHYAWFKTDWRDRTIDFSILTTVQYNADFDGDALSATRLLDKQQERDFAVFRPEYNLLDSNQVRKLSDCIKIPTPVISTLSNYLDKDIKVNPEKLRRMEVAFGN